MKAPALSPSGPTGRPGVAASLTDLDAVGDPVPTVDVRPDDGIRCAECRHRITAGSQAIQVQGAHTHTFRNPAGWSYRIGCFASAPGAAPSGIPTTEASWFPPYAWRFAHCEACGTHLGWWFVAADAFAGLITTRLS